MRFGGLGNALPKMGLYASRSLFQFLGSVVAFQKLHTRMCATVTQDIRRVVINFHDALTGVLKEQRIGARHCKIQRRNDT